MVAKSRNVEPARTVICGTRYGNVMASRGSVIPLFVEQVTSRPADHRHRPSHDALHDDARGRGGPGAYAFEHGSTGDIFVQKAPAATIGVLARALLELLGAPDHGSRSSARGTARSCTRPC